MGITSTKFRTLEYYSDFPKNLDPVPGRQDLSRKINENAVKESIKNIVLTEPGEKLFNPNFGCGIRGFLFEQMDPSILKIIQNTIKTSITTYEPRAEVLSVEASSSATSSNALSVNIYFKVLNNDALSSVQVQIQRIR